MTDNTDPQDATVRPAPPESPGRQLRRAREERGIDRADAARAANLGLSLVMAIEADDFATLGLPVYARGYYRRYAKALQVASEPVLAAYEQLTESPSPVPRIEQRDSIPYNAPSSWQRVLPVMALLAVVAVVFFAFFQSGDSTRAPAIVDETITDVRPGVSPPAQAADPVLSEPASRRPPVVDFARTNPAPPAATGDVPAEDAAARDLPEAGMSRGDAPPNDASARSVGVVPPNRLEIRTGPQPAWMEVTDALNNRLVYRLVGPEEQVQVEGEPPYRVNLGMAHTLQVQYGGRELDLQRYQDSAARVRITIAGNGTVVPR
ncbi:MAG: RodZ domain-containing protein [Oceanococcaceae bacterium]